MDVKAALITACLSCGISSDVRANGSVDCITPNEDIIVSIGMTRTTDFFLATKAYVKHGQEVWATNPNDGEAPLNLYQGMLESDRLAVDYFDEDLTSLIVSLRVQIREEMGDGYSGTAEFADGVVHSVFCTFG